MEMSMLGLASFGFAVLLVLCALLGYALPTLTRVLGWVMLIGTVPIGLSIHRYFSHCGEFMAGVCALFSVGTIIACALVALALVLAMFIGRKMRPANAKPPAPPSPAAVPGPETTQPAASEP
jgi:hypothetical protein